MSTYILWTSVVIFPNIIYAVTSGILTPIYRYIYPSDEKKLLLEIKEFQKELKELKEQNYIIIEKLVDVGICAENNKIENVKQNILKEIDCFKNKKEIEFEATNQGLE